MTNEEIIGRLERMAEHAVHTVGEKPYVIGLDDGIALHKAIDLLKLQEPKPVHVTADINYRKIGECPNCNKVINSGDYPNYCGQCGKAVKWDD